MDPLKMLQSNMPKLKQHGFSLIELMVVVSIVVVVASLAAPSYVGWIQNTRVRTATESILSGIQKARAEALKRNTPVRFALAANAGWTVSCVTPALCNDLTSGIVETRASNEGDTSAVVATPASGNVIFNGLGIQTTAGLSQVDLTLAQADRPFRITVSAGGTVRMCDPHASSSDPRKC